jgi:hypothetical protein
MKAPDLKAGQMITIAYIIGILIVLYIIYLVLEKVGLIKTSAQNKAAADKAAAVGTFPTLKVFDLDYLTNASYNPMPSDVAESDCTAIHDSIYGFFTINTDFNRINSTFGSLSSKDNVAELALIYSTKYSGRDMRADLLNNLNDAHILALTDIINGLPLH